MSRGSRDGVGVVHQRHDIITHVNGVSFNLLSDLDAQGSQVKGSNNGSSRSSEGLLQGSPATVALEKGRSPHVSEFVVTIVFQCGLVSGPNKDSTPHRFSELRGKFCCGEITSGLTVSLPKFSGF